MKNYYFLLIFLFSSIALTAQQFTTQFYFTDTLGNQDTVTVGFDPAATLGVDEIFGEVNLKEIPFGEDFEVRVGQVNYENLGCFPNDGPLNIHNIDSDQIELLIRIGKKDFNGISCENGNLIYQFFGKTTFFIKNKDLPIKINWDTVVFSEVCLSKSFFTDWHPGGWFDFIPCGGNQFVERMSEITEYWVNEPTNIQIVDRSGDTLSMVHLGWKDGLTSSTEEVELPTFNTFPNPVQDQLTVQFADAKIRSWELVDITGKTIHSGQFYSDSEILSVKKLPTGIYFLSVEGFRMQRIVVNAKQ